MEFLQDLFVLLGRVCIGSMFLWNSYEKLQHWGLTKAYMKAKNVPQLAIILPASIVLKVLGALSILLGWHSHMGAFLLLIVVVPSAAWLHAFWKYSGPEYNIEKMLFMKEVTIIGGLLLMLALGAGHWAFGGM